MTNLLGGARIGRDIDLLGRFQFLNLLSVSSGPRASHQQSEWHSLEWRPRRLPDTEQAPAGTTPEQLGDGPKEVRDAPLDDAAARMSQQGVWAEREKSKVTFRTWPIMRIQKCLPTLNVLEFL
jgi:hypothetical protein